MTFLQEERTEDEISMAHKGGLEALNRSLSDICNCEKLFGGLTVLICGDFQQILPVVKTGTPADELKACVQRSRHANHPTSGIR